MIRLEADDPLVRALTEEAIVAARRHDASLTIVCRKCGATLALTGRLPHLGVLFTSSWDVNNDEAVADRQLEARAWATLREMMGATPRPPRRVEMRVARNPRSKNS